MTRGLSQPVVDLGVLDLGCSSCQGFAPAPTAQNDDALREHTVHELCKIIHFQYMPEVDR